MSMLAAFLPLLTTHAAEPSTPKPQRPPKPTVSVGNVSVTETDTARAARVKVKLRKGNGKKVTVWWATADGTATAPSDYTASSGKIVFKGTAKKATRIIAIPVAGDDVFESAEQFEIRLTKIKKGRIKRSTGSVIVTNDDAAVMRTLTLNWSGAGGGTVTVSPTGSTCSGTCTMPVLQGAAVELNVTPNGSSAFAGWSGECGGTDATCRFTMSSDKTAGVAFTRLQLDPTLTPVYGSRSLSPSFYPDPSTVSVSAGGPINVDYLGGGCQGFTTQAPSYRFTYAGGSPTLLRFYNIGSAEADTVMVVRGPSGAYQCADDSFGTVHPTIDFNDPAAGTYDVWVGGFTAGSSIPSSLKATKNSTSHP
jgi:hypothetical protein